MKSRCSIAFSRLATSFPSVFSDGKCTGSELSSDHRRPAYEMSIYACVCRSQMYTVLNQGTGLPS